MQGLLVAATLGMLALFSSTAVAADAFVAAAGDIACDPGDMSFNSGSGTAAACHMGQTANQVTAWFATLSPAAERAVLVLGDNQYENGTQAKYLASYDLSWGTLKPWTRPVPGNHEYATPGGAGYYSYFGSAAANPSSGWYSYDLGAWHLVALNSNCEAIGGCGQGSPQEAWLKADLAAHPGVCTLAYWHHPRFSSGPHGDDPKTDALWRALYDRGADVVLVGHDHIYERFHRQTPWGAVDATGPRQFTVGTGGKNLTGQAAVSANQAFLATTFGVLRLTLKPAAYVWEFVDDAGAVLDTGTTACHPLPSPRPAVYFTIAPCRLADTRNSIGPSGGPALAPAVARWFPAAGVCGIPAGAVAIAVNATAVDATGDGSIELYGAGDTVPLATVVSFRSGRVRAASAVVPLGQGGALGAVASLPTGKSVQLVLDVSGYFLE